MTALTLHNVGLTDHLVSPEEFTDVGPQSPALALFTDFRRHEPHVIVGCMPAVEAAEYMNRTHAHIRLVVDRNREFIGTVTLHDLTEASLLKKVASGVSRSDIQVMDLMHHRHEIHALSYADVRHATVKDIIDTLRDNGEQHCLVVDEETHSIRGLIAAGDIAARLHQDIELGKQPTFAEIFSAVHH